MSFDVRKKLVEEGDTVVLYMGRQTLQTFEVEAGKIHQTKFGCYPHDQLLGKTYGSKISSSRGKGWVYLLHPTPELWTLTLPHRTQILYSADISMILFELELKPGSIVVESGTGSGSLSHAIIRTVKPDGHLFTFDFHQNRVLKAREEFDKHGVGEYVTSACADVCADGFSLSDKADAVFLDLPSPWDAIPHAKASLKKSGGRICSFSPCIEQVQRTCDNLRKNHFCDIKTVECLVHNLVVTTLPVPEFTFEDKLTDMAESGIKKQKLDTSVCLEQLVTNENSDKVNTSDTLENNGEELIPVSSPSSDTLKEVNGGDKLHSVSTVELINGSAETNGKSVTGLNFYNMVSKLTAQSKKGNINVMTSKPKNEVPGHTGYLTFASLYPFY